MNKEEKAIFDKIISINLKGKNVEIYNNFLLIYQVGSFQKFKIDIKL